jgi:16S rRNA (guanine1207-N2)-methyltransferase
MRGQYFSTDERAASRPRSFTYEYRDKPYVFETDAGVFSADGMDGGTDALLRSLPALSGSLLDMGCGCGCVGVVLAKEYALAVTQADVNPRALRLTAANAARNGVVTEVVASDGYANIGGAFDTIVINPPIHAGKGVVFGLYDGAFAHLKAGGALYVVIMKKHGAPSTVTRLNEVFGGCEILCRKKGRYVLQCVKK